MHGANLKISISVQVIVSILHEACGIQYPRTLDIYKTFHP